MKENKTYSALKVVFVVIGALVSIGALVAVAYTLFRKYFKVTFEDDCCCCECGDCEECCSFESEGCAEPECCCCECEDCCEDEPEATSADAE